jgi:hypothetical protein
MPRRRGQAGLDWATPDNVPPRDLQKYLCELGPRYCPRCPSKGAFGERYLALRRAEKERSLENAR